MLSCSFENKAVLLLVKILLLGLLCFVLLGIRLFSDFYVLILENNRTQMLEYQENSLSLR